MGDLSETLNMINQSISDLSSCIELLNDRLVTIEIIIQENKQ